MGGCHSHPLELVGLASTHTLVRKGYPIPTTPNMPKGVAPPLCGTSSIVFFCMFSCEYLVMALLPAPATPYTLWLPPHGFVPCAVFSTTKLPACEQICPSYMDPTSTELFTLINHTNSQNLILNSLLTPFCFWPATKRKKQEGRTH